MSNPNSSGWDSRLNLTQFGISEVALPSLPLFCGATQQPRELKLFDEVGEGRSRSLNRSEILSQSSRIRQFPPLNEGYLNWAQGNGQQGRGAMFSMGLGSQQQQPDTSLYGAPVGNARGNMGQQPPLYQEPGSLAASGQSQKQLLDLNNPFLKCQFDSSPPEQQQGGFMSNLGLQGRGMSEAGSGNLLPQQVDSSGRQEEQGSWSSFEHKDTTKLSQGLVPLDPLEEKILFSMEDSSSISEIASGVFGDSVSFSSPFPSMQNGSWSALMQNAVASSDTRLPEEFSGLTYQNMDISANVNDVSNFIDSDKQQPGCVNANGPLNSSFPGFQVPSNQLRPGLFQDDSTPVSTQRSSNVTGHWVDCNPQPKISRMSFDNLSTGNRYMQSSGMFDQLQSQTGIHRSSTALSSSLVPRQLGQAGMFPQFMQQNDPSIVSVSQMQTANPFVASLPDNATLPGVNLDPGRGGHTASQTRSPQRGTNQQFNVLMDLQTRQHLLDQESLKVPSEILKSDVTSWHKVQQMSSAGYNVQQRIGLPQEQGAAAKNISDFTASNKDFNKLPMDSGMSSMSQFKSFAFPGPKMEQIGAPRNDQMQPAHESQEIPQQLPQHSKPINTMSTHAEIISPKKLHALQMQQQNFSNPYSSTAQKQANSSRQFPTLLNEMPLNDSSQGYLNLAQGNATPGQQGTLGRTTFSMALGSQQPDTSLYGAPVGNARGNMGQQPPIQAMYQEPGSLAARLPSGQSQKPLMQLSNCNYPFLKSQYDSSPPQQGAFMSNLGVQGRGMSEVGSVNFGNLPPQQVDSSPKDSSRRQEEQASWSPFQQKDTTKLSQGLVPAEILKSDVTTWQKAQHMSSTGYNLQHRIGLPQEQGAAAKNISDPTASDEDCNKLPVPVDSGMSSMSQLKSFAFPGPKSEQMGASQNDQMQPAHESQELPDQLPQHSKPLNTMNKHAEIIAPKKRKLMRTKKLAWHEEVSNTSQRDHTFSDAEQEWARVANFLAEKAEYDTHTFEFAPPLHRSKRRLVITAQLMQQLFDPPPSLLLFSKASSSYDVLCFFIARATIGDACSLTHKRGNGLPSSSHEVEKIPEKIERKDVQYSEVAKSVTEKANKLKESFERLKKTPSMAEIKLDIEDLERFSVISRFARFHSKGPVSGNPSQSSLLKPMPQRYVAVGPLPRSIPEGVQCISL